MTRSRWTALALFLAVASSPGETQDGDKRTHDDILQLKDGSLLVGRILSVSDTGVEMQLKAGGKVSPPFKDLVPYSVYRVKADRIDGASGQAHFDLAEFCMAQGFWSYAVVEYDKAAMLDKALADRARTNRDKAFNEDARTKFEEAKRFIAEKRYEEAERLLSILVTTYKETPWAKEAVGEMTRLTEEIKKDNESKRRALEDKARAKADAAAKSREEGEKSMAVLAGEALEEAKRLWAEGLDWEAKGNLTKADRAWKAADARLSTGKRHVETLSKSADTNLVKQSRDLDKEIDGWFVKTYYRLGRMWATELNYAEGLTWLNRGLRLAPDDHLMNEVLLTLTQAQMRKRAAGGGY